MASMESESWSCELDVDGAVLLMKMLDQDADDAHDADDEQLGGVIRSLEAEISRTADSESMAVDDVASTTWPSDGGEMLMEDLLSDLETRESLRVEEPFDWAEMDAVARSDWDYFAEAAGLGGAGEVFCYGEGREYVVGGGFCYGESLAAEQVFDPLWH